MIKINNKTVTFVFVITLVIAILEYDGGTYTTWPPTDLNSAPHKYVRTTLKKPLSNKTM